MNTWKTYVFSDQAGIDSVLNDFMIQGNKSIFLDMAWAHHAYASSGIWSLDYLKEEQTNDGSLFNNPYTNYEGWEGIDEGVQDGVIASLREGNKNILRREQQIVMQPMYNVMKNVWLNPGNKLEQYLATDLAGISYPPTNANGEINVDEMFTINGRNPLARDTGPTLREVTAGGLLSDFDDRWAWIDNAQNGMIQIWLGTSVAPQGYNANQRASWNMTPLKNHALFYSMLPTAGNFNSLQFPPSW